MAVLEVVELQPPYIFRSPFAGEFVVLIVAGAPNLTPEDQQLISVALVESGCRYAVCAGMADSYSVDLAFMSTDPNFDPPEDRFVMTSWHEGEADHELASFFARHTAFDDFVPEQFLVLSLGAPGRARVDPGGTHIWGTGPYLKVPNSIAGDDGNQRIECSARGGTRRTGSARLGE